jgi:hypothetical protein
VLGAPVGPGQLQRQPSGGPSQVTGATTGASNRAGLVKTKLKFTLPKGPRPPPAAAAAAAAGTPPATVTPTSAAKAASPAAGAGYAAGAGFAAVAQQVPHRAFGTMQVCGRVG